MQFNQPRPQMCFNNRRCIFSTFKWKFLLQFDPVLRIHVPIPTGKCTFCATFNAGKPLSLLSVGKETHFSVQTMTMHFKSPPKSALCSQNGSKSHPLQYAEKGALVHCVGASKFSSPVLNFFHSAGSSGVDEMHPYLEYS